MLSAVRYNDNYRLSSATAVALLDFWTLKLSSEGLGLRVLLRLGCRNDSSQSGRLRTISSPNWAYHQPKRVPTFRGSNAAVCLSKRVLTKQNQKTSDKWQRQRRHSHSHKTVCCVISRRRRRRRSSVTWRHLSCTPSVQRDSILIRTFTICTTAWCKQLRSHISLGVLNCARKKKIREKQSHDFLCTFLRLTEGPLQSVRMTSWMTTHYAPVSK